MNNLNKLCTWLRMYAYECGGNHHDNAEIQKDLLLKADELQDIGYKLVDLAKQVQKYTGVTDIHYRTHLRVQDITKGEEE